MEYAYPITIQPETTKIDPERIVTGLCTGMLVSVEVYFPWGCAGEVGIRILHYESQLYPTNRAAWFTGNDIHITFDCKYEIKEGSGAFKIEGYNNCDFYEHTPIVFFNVIRQQEQFAGSPGWVGA